MLGNIFAIYTKYWENMDKSRFIEQF